jgi:hypothetical protein
MFKLAVLIFQVSNSKRNCWVELSGRLEIKLVQN